ncbi:MAG: hypothetical protein ACI9MC_000501 [Kiritimatiellia bacterium]|jgi:hypothetical protein
MVVRTVDERTTLKARKVSLWLMGLSTASMVLFWLLLGGALLIETLVVPSGWSKELRQFAHWVLASSLLSVVVGLVLHAFAVMFTVSWWRLDWDGERSAGERLLRGAAAIWVVLWSALWVFVGLLAVLGSGSIFFASVLGRPSRVVGLALRVPPRFVGWGRVWPRGMSIDRVTAGLAWTHSAMVEHASAPVFDELARDLISVSAPADLVERARQAAVDERAHARRAYSVVEHITGVRLELGGEPKLPRRGEPSSVRMKRLAHQAWHDGVVGEGVAAHIAGELAQLTDDPIIARHLRAIASEEAQHALLAADVLAWCELQGIIVECVWPKPVGGRRHPRLTKWGVTDAFTANRALVRASVEGRPRA